MNITELKARLVAEGFDRGVYSVDGTPLPYEGLMLRRAGGEWVIDHFERGVHRRLATLASEEQACARMHELLIQYFR